MPICCVVGMANIMYYNVVMTTSTLQDNVNWLLIRSSMVGKQRIIKIAEGHDLSIMQALTLCTLEPNKPVAMSVISETFSCDPSNVTGIVERLSNGGYIERRESPVDRRVKTINLTKSGNSLRTNLLNKIAEVDSSNLSNLTEAETATLKAILSKMLPESDSNK